MRGVLAAIAPSWLVLVGATGLTFWQIGLRNNPSPWLVAYIWVVWGSIFPALSFGSGVICAFFWQPIIAGENYRKWSGWATLGIFAPMIFGCGGGCLTLMIAYLPCLWLFNKGVAQGFDLVAHTTLAPFLRIAQRLPTRQLRTRGKRAMKFPKLSAITSVCARHRVRLDAHVAGFGVAGADAPGHRRADSGRDRQFR